MHIYYTGNLWYNKYIKLKHKQIIILEIIFNTTTRYLINTETKMVNTEKKVSVHNSMAMHMKQIIWYRKSYIK